MRSNNVLSGASALLLISSLASAKHGVHDHIQALHHQHHERVARSTPETAEVGVEIRAASPETVAPAVEKRDGQCAFPYDAGLVPVTPGSSNAGWAMSPDQPCKPGGYCPYACPPGQVMAQWDPKATSYTYPQSMNGGLYCDNNGQISKPFPDKPYCKATATNIGVTNEAGGVVSFCQTVLPGNEAMLIPTEVYDTATLANPGTDYWCKTAAHYYINAPGVSAGEACVWGTKDQDVGNWSPYVAGTNVDDSGETFIKLGWNPIYLEPATPFRNQMPDWGVRIDCPDGKCNGLPCSISPKDNWVNQMTGSKSNGAGGGSFCVVTVPRGSTANFVVFGGSASGKGPGPFGGGNGWQDSGMSSTASEDASSTTSSSWGSSTWASSNSSSSTTSWGPNPSKMPNKNLFATGSSSAEKTLTTPVEQKPSATAAPTAAPSLATSGSTRQQWSIAGLAVAMMAAVAML